MKDNQKDSQKNTSEGMRPAGVGMESQSKPLGGSGSLTDPSSNDIDNLHGIQQAAQAPTASGQGNGGTVPPIIALAAQQPARWASIPKELRDRPQWCVADSDKSPKIAIEGLPNAKSNDPSTWRTFDEACAIAVRHGLGIGYMLHESDKFICIDLDVKDNTPPEQWERFQKIVTAFDSYTEHSRSGKGYHVWIEGTPDAGCRRDGVEVYSRERFIICTGNVVIDKPIAARPELLNMLVSEIRAAQATTTVELVEVDEAEPDEAIWQRGADAANGDKFRQLWDGKWSEMGYPSQSEADLALLSMLAFYTRSNEQARRLFRMSELGQRDKATKDNRYIDRTLANIRGRQEREDERAASIEAKSAELVQQVRATSAAQPGHLGNPTESQVQTAPAAPVPPAGNGLAWPPGFAGELARFIYSTSARPVPEVSIVAALGLLAGVCGRAYTISDKGLNLYLLMVARSATGKEAMHSGPGKLLDLAEMEPAQRFAVYTDYASGPALMKGVLTNPSHVNVVGEVGRKFKRMASDRESQLTQLRTDWTNLWEKSGPQDRVPGLAYSDDDKDVLGARGVAFSLMGETTPDTFLEALTPDMAADGFLSRFLIIEYNGPRPPLNRDRFVNIAPAVLATWRSLLTQALPYGSVINVPARTEVKYADERVEHALNAFGDMCDLRINETTNEWRRQLWNRAHMKALKVAALLACADHCVNPRITSEHVDWALTLIRNDIETMTRRLDNGDVGISDDSREKKLLNICKTYLEKPVPKGYGFPDEMRAAGVVPRKYLQTRARNVKALNDHKLGATAALDLTIRSMIDSGYLVEVAKDKMADAWGPQGKCFRILNLNMQDHD